MVNIKYFLIIIIAFINFLFMDLIVCKAQSNIKINLSQKDSMGKCPVNPDSSYNRKEILRQFAKILNKSIPQYKKRYPGFYITGETPGDFFVYDLTDPLNKTSEPNKTGLFNCVDLIDNHVYHFTSYKDEYAASHIAILENGKLKVFKSINCPESKDRLENVLTYLNQKLKDDKNKDEIIDRVKNYRKYGVYYSSNESSYYCKSKK